MLSAGAQILNNSPSKISTKFDSRNQPSKLKMNPYPGTITTTKPPIMGHSRMPMQPTRNNYNY